jgi:hypothetical protein
MKERYRASIAAADRHVIKTTGRHVRWDSEQARSARIADYGAQSDVVRERKGL